MRDTHRDPDDVPPIDGKGRTAAEGDAKSEAGRTDAGVSRTEGTHKPERRKTQWNEYDASVADD